MKNKLPKWFKLKEKLDKFNIPAQRRDITQLGNVLWLGRNLPINNVNNPLLGEVMTEINKLAITMMGEVNKDYRPQHKPVDLFEEIGPELMEEIIKSF